MLAQRAVHALSCVRSSSGTVQCLALHPPRNAMSGLARTRSVPIYTTTLKRRGWHRALGAEAAAVAVAIWKWRKGQWRQWRRRRRRHRRQCGSDAWSDAGGGGGGGGGRDQGLPPLLELAGGENPASRPSRRARARAYELRRGPTAPRGGCGSAARRATPT